MEQELKKCPACGGEAEFSKYHYLIICNNCEIMQMEMDECKVLEAWNNQPRIEQLKQRTKDLEQALKVLIDDVPKLVKKAYFEPTDREFSDFERSNLNIDCNYLLKQAKAVSDG